MASRSPADVDTGQPVDRAAIGEPRGAPPAREILERLSRRAVVDRIRPSLDGGRFPIKRSIGEWVDVSADILADGHDVLAAVLRDHPTGTAATAEHAESEISAVSAGSAVGFAWRETPMTLAAPGTDEWIARFDVHGMGWHEYQIVAWVDRFLTWQRDIRVKAAAGQDVSLELLEGSLLVREAAARAEQIAAGRPDANWLLERADGLCDATPVANRVELALEEDLTRLMALYADRSRATTSETLRIWVDRERARFGAWYEMFPRSAGPDANRSGTFAEAARELTRIADLGFDIVYLPPIHPIGTSFRKGRNNSLVAGPDDPGSPWAIGSPAGGHTAVEPGLGTLDDFEAFRCEAEHLGLEVALDLAWQCSPDHPWVSEHPEWFRHRPDGTIKYAENPPKKYQDIYPFDFESEDWRGLWQALLDVTLFWIDHGVKIFRVDNPHTKTFGFWDWMIDQVRQTHPDVVFLSEAFTRPKVMRYLAKIGFTQSYTYFTWRNTKDELTEYFTELTTTESREYLRPNLFANTPDILHAYLQHGGRPAFVARLILAATLGANYGIYNGFELCEGRALKPGSEEYWDSEKYQYRKWDWDRPANISELVCRVNRIRHAESAFQFDHTLRFHATDNPEIIAYSKAAPEGGLRLLTIVNLDPHHTQHGFVETPVDADVFAVHDLLDDATYTWHRGWNYVRFDPDIRQAHILKPEATHGA
jgi:starch synthase (maltosyl-transferring)